MTDLSKWNWAHLWGRLKPPALNLLLSQGRAGAALVIRPSRVQLLCLDKKQAGKSVSIPIEGSGEEHLLDALNKAVAEAQLKSRRVAVSVHSPEVLLRSFRMPAIPRAEWETAVPFEARKYIPFKMNELAWDFQVIGGSPMDVVFAALPSAVCSRYSRLLEAAALQPAMMEPMGASLARLMLFSGKPVAAEGFVCLVDVEQERALLVIASKGAPYFTRDVSLAASDGRPDVQRLISELRVSLDFFAREHPAASVSRVVLFGEETLLRGWVEGMAIQLARPVELASSWLALLGEQGVSSTFGPACGLLRAEGQPPVELNFLKRSSFAFQSAVKSPGQPVHLSMETLAGAARQPRTLTAAAVSAAMVVFCLWLVSQQQVNAARHQLKQLQAGRPQAPRLLAGRDQKALEALQATCRSQLEILETFSDEQASVAAKMDALARAMPEGVWLTGISFENRSDGLGKGSMRLTLNGACFLGGGGKELGAIQDFERRIRQSAVLGGMGTAQVANIAAQAGAQGKQPFRTFQVNCQSARKL